MIALSVIGVHTGNALQHSSANIEENRLLLLHGTSNSSQNIVFIYSSCLPKLPAVLNIDTVLTNELDSLTDHVNDQLKTMYN